MIKYSYKVQDEENKVLEGVLEAPSTNEAERFLSDRQLQVLSLKKYKEPFSLQGLKDKLETVKSVNFNFFVRQLATLLKAGVPLLTCLQALHEEAHDPVLKKAVFGLYEDVEQGTGFSDSCAKYPKVFNNLFVSTVRAGEAIGELDTALVRLADLFEKDYQTQQKIKSALRYPMLLIGVMTCAFLMATLFIIPKFKDLFSMFGANLPLPTRILMFTSEFVINYWYICFLLVAGAAAGVAYHYHSHKGRRFWDNLLLNTWLVGLFIRNGIYSRFCRMLGMMLKSGVNILPALDLVSNIVSNSIYEDSIQRMKEEVGQGNTISQQMRQEGLFPTLIVQMVSVGETSGRIDEMLAQASDHYDAEMDRLTKNLESMIEPFFIMVLAIFVGVLALGIFLPMWDLYALIGTQS